MWLYNFVTVHVQGQSVMVDRLGAQQKNIYQKLGL